MRRTVVIVFAVVAMLASATFAVADHRYPDVREDHRYHDETAWFADNGLAPGYADGTFRLRSPMLRGTTAAWLYRMWHNVVEPRLDEQDVRIAELEARVVALEDGEPGPSEQPTVEPTPDPSPSPEPTPSPSPTPTPEPSPPPSGDIACRGDTTGPVTIDDGGDYQVNVDTDGTGVTVSTAEPVTISGCIEAGGRQIDVTAGGADVTVDRVRGEWTATEQQPAHAGRFVKMDNPKRLVVRNSEIVRSEGIRVDGSTGATVRIKGNKVTDVRQVGAQENPFAQFVQLADLTRADVEIFDNQVTNSPDVSRIEDVISIYQTSGTAGNPVHIRGNVIDGAYPQPNGGEFTGGGIMAGDGASAPTKHVLVEGNVVRNTTNYGIAVASGSENMVVRDNCVVHTIDALPASNVGIYAWSWLDDPDYGGVTVVDNRVYWVNPDGRNDWWFPDTSDTAGNVRLSEPSCG